MNANLYLNASGRQHLIVLSSMRLVEPVANMLEDTEPERRTIFTRRSLELSCLTTSSI